MRWAVLPVAGGLYDQHPRLLEAWSVIFEERERYREQERRKQEQEMKAKTHQGRGRRR